MPIILKGIGCWEDAVLAAEAGVQGIVLSNHGGRQLDMARSGIEVLVEVVDALKMRGLFPNPNFEIYVDGGVRRATDVLKALALGAKAVGLGRPFLYSFCAYGEEGVEHAIKIIRVRDTFLRSNYPANVSLPQDELEMNMRLLGIRTLDELKPEMVDARALNSHTGVPPQDNLFNSTCKFANVRINHFTESLRFFQIKASCYPPSEMQNYKIH